MSIGVSIKHALDPLSEEEIRAAVRIVRERPEAGAGLRFISVDLAEPSKQEIAACEAGEPVPRRARMILLDRPGNVTYEATVNVDDGTVIAWAEVPGVQPEIMRDEFDEAEQVIRDSPLYQEALARRGITDMDGVCVDPWSAGSWGVDDRGRRLMRALTWLKLDGPDDNLYAHPIDGLVAIIDLNRMEVVEIEEHFDPIVPIPAQPENYVPERVGPQREAPAPLEIIQPEGPGFTVNGNELVWQKWRLRVGFTHREGLILHAIGYEDESGLRPVLHRASCSSMVVPYGDPSPTQHLKNAFDVGEYGLGYLANSLELGCDCLGEIRYLDAALCDSRGEPYTIKNAICIHEEDDGILWKHTDFRTNRAEVRRTRRLVVSTINTVGNYEYAFYWRFYQDGTIEHDIKLTGIMTTGAVRPGEAAEYGQLLNGDGLYAPIHQHFFNYRLDFDVDGVENTVYEIEAVVPEPGENPYGNAFKVVERPLTTELGARRGLNAAADRHWKVASSNRRNRVGQATAYRLIPKASTTPYWTARSPIAKRGAFADKSVWVTPLDETQLYAAGAYPYQNPDAGGLPEWTEADRPVADRDIVVWYSFGSFHQARLEDWPVMPAQHAGFRIEPCGFFDANPALDLPATKKHHCCD